MRALLILVLLAELTWSGWIIRDRLLQAKTPEVDLSRLDPLTAEELQALAAKTRPNRTEDWQTLGEAYLGNGYNVAAEQCFHKAVILDPKNVQARYAQGFCLERTGQTSAAIPVLTECAEQASGDLVTTCWYQIGRCQLREENIEAAEAAFRNIEDFTPGAYQLSKLLIRTGKAEEAVAILDKHLLKYPNSLKLLQQRRHAAIELGEIALANQLRDREDRAEYVLVLEYGQSFIGMFASRIGLAKILSRALDMKDSGSLEQRDATLSRALKVILPNQLWQYRSVLLAAAHVKVGLGALEEAESLIQNLETYTRGGTDLDELRAVLAAKKGDSEEAFHIWTKIAALRPSADAYEQLAAADRSISDSDRQRFLALAQLYAAIDLFRRNELEEARERLEPLTTTLTDHPLFYFYLGEVYQGLNDRQLAQKAYDRCLELDPGFSRCQNRRLLLSGDHQELEPQS